MSHCFKNRLIFVDSILKIFASLIVLFDNIILLLLLFEKMLILLEFPALFKAAVKDMI